MSSLKKTHWINKCTFFLSWEQKLLCDKPRRRRGGEAAKVKGSPTRKNFFSPYRLEM
jgi:hypothetical protein